MSIHIVKKNYSKALREVTPDAVLKTQLFNDCFPADRIETATEDNDRLVITGYLPSYTGEECHSQIQRIYLNALEIARQNECKSILITIPYEGQAYASVKKLFGVAVKASYEALINNIFRNEIYIVLGMQLREQILEDLPRVETIQVPVMDDGNEIHTLENNTYTLSFCKERKNAAGVKEVVRVPDSLHKALMDADWEPIYYYDEDHYSKSTASQLLAKHMSEKFYTKDKIYSKLEYYVGRTTVYNYLNADYTKRPSKDPLVYISLAMKLPLNQAMKVLYAAGWKLDRDDPIDMVYAAAFEARADVCEMVSWLDVEGMLDAAKRRDGIKFITVDDIDKE